MSSNSNTTTTRRGENDHDISSSNEMMMAMSSPPPTTLMDDPNLFEIGHYVVTAQPSGSVSSAIKCSFLSSNSIDVVIAKSTRIEVRQFQQPLSDDKFNDKNKNDNIADVSNLFPLVLTLPINGRITSLVPIRFGNASRDCLFFTTERGGYALISYDDLLKKTTGQHYPIRTHATGTFSSYGTSVIAGGRQAECGPLVAVDPLHRCIALHVYDGFVTILPLNRGYDVQTTSQKPRGLSSGPFGDAYHARIEERTLLSMAFLQTNHNATYIPQLVILHQDSRGFQHIITHGIDIARKGILLHGSSPTDAINAKPKESYTSKKPPASIMPPPPERLRKSRIDGASATIIPIPPPRLANRSSSKSTLTSLGGVLILGHRQITYHSTAEGITRILPIPQTLMLTHCAVMENDFNLSVGSSDDASTNTGGILRYLLGDETGRLHLLTILRNITPDGGDGRVTSLHLDVLGVTSLSSALVYLGKGCFFVGSQFGDSQLIRILETPTTPTSNNEDTMIHPLEETTYLQILEEYINLGPIVDFDLRPCGNANNSSKTKNDFTFATHSRNDGIITSSSSLSTKSSRQQHHQHHHQHHQSLIVTASGVAKDGTVRLVRNGVGMKEHAAVEMNGIKGMWNLRRKFQDQDDSFLVQSFVRETRILGVLATNDINIDNDMENMKSKDKSKAMEAATGFKEQEEEPDSDNEEDEEGGGGALAEVTIPGFNASRPTLYAINVSTGKFDLLLQVVEDSVRLVDSETLELVTEWSPFRNYGQDDDDDDDDDEPMAFITVASANESGQVVVALRGGTLVYLIVEGNETPTIRRLGLVNLDREISCIDLHPFDPTYPSTPNNDEDAMEVENSESRPTDSHRKAIKSNLVAVGLWDDFSVRLLYLGGDGLKGNASPLPYSILEQVLRINLGVGDDNNNDDSHLTITKSDSQEQHGSNSQHMMARSLCLVTLDSPSSSNNSFITKRLASPKRNNKVDMLLVGLGDGILISFVVASPEAPANAWSVHSRKEVCLGTQGIHLVPFQHGHSSHEGESSVSSAGSGTCVLATGDRPTVVYLTGRGGGNNNNPKLCYSTISLTAEDDDNGEDSHANQRNIFVNVAAPFRSSLLFSSDDPHSNRTYSLCVADENTLRLGMIDNIQKLHVTSYKLGMTPRRIAYHESGRVYCVGCIGATNGIDGVSNNQIGGEANMGNCVRFFDDSTFEEINRIDLEPFEMILSLSSVSLRLNSPNAPQSNSAEKSNEIHKPFILIGTAYAYPDEDEPSQGRVLVVECNSNNSEHLRAELGDNEHEEDYRFSRIVRHVTQMTTKGGVYCMTPFFDGTILITVNSKTHLCKLFNTGSETAELKFAGSGHHGHMLSLFVKSIAGTAGGSSSSSSTRHAKQLAIVGDLMRSISLVEYQPKHQVIEELARDYNSNFCTAIEMLTNGIYLGSENFNNLFVLRHNANASSEEARVRLDTIGEYHLGEMINKFMGGSLVMPSNSGNSLGTIGVPATSPNGKVKSDKVSYERNRKMDLAIGSQTLFGTVDGTIGSVFGLDGSTFAFFSTLQRAMIAIVRPVGDLSHEDYRSFEAEQRIRPSRGFIDGDLIETFLDLNRPTMERVVKCMNEDGRWKIRDHGLGLSTQTSNHQNLMDADDGIDDEAPSSSSICLLSVEDVLGAVEEISMLH